MLFYLDRMDKKGKSLDMGYPNLMFCVDNFEDVRWTC